MKKLDLDAFAFSLQQLPQPRRYLLALSGGLDSVVLLHLLSTLQARVSTPLAAIHVHHGLNPHADAWSRFCDSLCQSRQLPLQIVHVDIEARPDEGIEAAARHARYAAFAAALAPGEALVTAHHGDDQAETFLLQALRGAGVAGLAAMPPARPFGDGLLLRPLLPWTRRELEAFARRHDLHWIDDDSNQDRSFDRNYLRHEVMPVLAERWPGLVHTLGRATALQRDARQLLDEIAAADLAECRKSGEPVSEQPEWTLPVPPILSLSPERRRNLLRYWIRGLGCQVPDHDRLEAVLTDLLPAREDAEPRISWADLELRRYRGHLYLLPVMAPPAPHLSLAWDLRGPLTIPDIGTLDLEPAQGAGLAATRLAGCRARVGLRQGGERLSLAGRQGSHSLKHLLQEAAVPPWQRQRLPLLYIDEELVAVPGLGIAADWQAAPGQPGQQLLFRPARPGGFCPDEVLPVSSGD